MAVVAALSREVAGLVRGWDRSERRGGVVVYTSDRGVVSCAGMGGERATLALAAALEVRSIDRVVSVGLAGACDPALRVGAVVRAGLVVDTRTGERYRTGEAGCVLATSASVAGIAGKRRLRETYGADAVDMEAAAVARLALAAGREFRAIKAISDEAEFAMPAMDRWVTGDGQFRERAFALHSALRPGVWGPLLRLARNSRRALLALTEEMDRELD